MMDELLAISPVDGRYRENLEELRKYFSEFALMKYRLRVELEYLKFVTAFLKDQSTTDLSGAIDSILINFSISEARRVKLIEKETKHDVEALIRYIKEKLTEQGLSELSTLVHIGLTSEDVSNIAYSLMLRDFNEEFLLPLIKEFLLELVELAKNEKSTIMVARTHGIPALPTTLGKELMVYVYRILKLYEFLSGYRFPGKISGAVGTYAAPMEIFGEDVIRLLADFITSLGLEPWIVTKQILPHDDVSRYLQALSILAGGLVDLCRDLWLLTMMGYIVVRRSGVGSSTMPQKINPIEIENAEGNLEFSSNMLNFLSYRLLASRLQRDLSDSTLKRNYGAAISYLVLGIKNLRSFLRRIEFNRESMKSEVEKHPEILSEAVQVRMRLLGRDVMEDLRRLDAVPEKYIDEVKKIIEKVGINPDQVIPKTFEEYIGAASQIVETIYKLCVDRLKKDEKAVN